MVVRQALGSQQGHTGMYIRREALLRMFEKVSRSPKYDSNIFFVHKHIYIYGHQPRSLYPRSHCACGVIIEQKEGGGGVDKVFTT